MKLSRSQTERVIAGVCGGLAEHLGVSASRLRVVWVLGAVFSAAFPGLFLYLALWYLLPQAPTGFEVPVLQPWKQPA